MSGGQCLSKFAVCGVNMNNTEAKGENGGNGNAARSNAWESSRREIAGVAGVEQAVDLSLRSHRNKAEVYAIDRALRETAGNRTQAAKLLSISYRSLLYKIRQYKIDPTVERG
jgi:DNA-binding NtrC family response regulator